MTNDQHKSGILDWESKGRYALIEGHKIFYLEYNLHKEKTICILHGYPTCSYDYYKCEPYLSNYRVVIHDHLGFGLSDKPQKYSYNLEDQATIAIKLWKKLGIEKMHLIAHDYGTSIATEILALDNEHRLEIDIQSLVLSNGSMLIDMAKLRFIQKLLKNNISGPLVAKLT